MKTIVKQTTKLLLILLLISGGSQLWAQSNKDYFAVRGVVKDKITQKSLAYANISVQGTNIGTIANINGEFSVKIKDSLNAKSVEVSHLGYSTFVLPVKGENIKEITIYLSPKANLLDEITVYSLDPRALVEEAISKIKTNYSSTTDLLSGFYRETVRKRRSYITVSEAVVDIYKSPYTEGVEKDMLQIEKGRKLVSPKLDDTLMVKLLGGPNLSIFVDIVKNPDLILSMETLSNYKFYMEQSVVIDERPNYVVSFKPQVVLPYALYYGKLYIDKQNLAVSRTEFSLSMDDRNKAIQAILKRKPFSMRFKPEEISFLVTYKQRDGLTHLNYIRSEVRFKCDWKRRLFSTNYTIVSETVITGGKTDVVNKIPHRFAFSNNQSLSDNVINFFDKDFWEDYNIIEPDESLESAIGRLKKEEKR
ncbi:MAG: hypothetical protein A2X18_02775 [Bacteroidetes bacterium GWF2_40_14]|nr:MAG: hypothetical protein A2X18_02775 [Bacteroidetes bacterium GWF2_40_14]